jgi:hypothetical protein
MGIFRLGRHGGYAGFHRMHEMVVTALTRTSALIHLLRFTARRGCVILGPWLWGMGRWHSEYVWL